MKPNGIIQSLHAKNYRPLQDIDLKGITPLTVFLGPNCSGKSKTFDVFAFSPNVSQRACAKHWINEVGPRSNALVAFLKLS